MNDTNTNLGPYATPPKRELSAGSKLRFWKQAFLASMQCGRGAELARLDADASVIAYNAKFQELFPS